MERGTITSPALESLDVLRSAGMLAEASTGAGTYPGSTRCVTRKVALAGGSVEVDGRLDGDSDSCDGRLCVAESMAGCGLRDGRGAGTYRGGGARSTGTRTGASGVRSSESVLVSSARAGVPLVSRCNVCKLCTLAPRAVSYVGGCV